MVTTPSNTTGRFCPRARFRRPRINLAMLVLIVVMTTVVHGGTSIGAHSNDPELHQPNNVSATPIEAVIFNGRVTINGETPAYSGFEITARIGDVWESYPVTVGADPNKPFEYANLGVAPPHELDLIGSEVEFWLEGQVKSSVKNYYAIVNEFTGEVCFECTFVFGIVRELDLDFPSLPDPTPTPIPTDEHARTVPDLNRDVEPVSNRTDRHAVPDLNRDAKSVSNRTDRHAATDLNRDAEPVSNRTDRHAATDLTRDAKSVSNRTDRHAATDFNRDAEPVSNRTDRHAATDLTRDAEPVSNRTDRHAEPVSNPTNLNRDRNSIIESTNLKSGAIPNVIASDRNPNAIDQQSGARRYRRRIQRNLAASNRPRAAADRYRCLLWMAKLKKVQRRGLS